jgi:hypothetical protein
MIFWSMRSSLFEMHPLVRAEILIHVWVHVDPDFGLGVIQEFSCSAALTMSTNGSSKERKNGLGSSHGKRPRICPQFGPPACRISSLIKPRPQPARFPAT